MEHAGIQRLDANQHQPVAKGKGKGKAFLFSRAADADQEMHYKKPKNSTQARVGL